MKIPPRLFIITTFIGTLVRDSIFLYIGYEGTQLLSAIANQSTSIESLVQTLILATIVGALGYFYYKRKRITV